MKDWEKDLPPIAKERLARIGQPTQEEKEALVNSEKADALLSEFYQARLDAEGLWKKLKEENSPSLLKQVQTKLVDSLGLGTSSAELERRKKGILAVETLKKERNTSAVELTLNMMQKLQMSYQREIQETYDGVRAEVERNPRLRLKQVQQGENTMVIQLTVDEAIKQLPQWKEFLANQEKIYTQEFAKLREKLRKELR